MTAGRDESATVDIKIRMKEPLRAEIECAAKAKGISMNAEMISRLQRSFLDDRLERIEHKIDALSHGKAT